MKVSFFLHSCIQCIQCILPMPWQAAAGKAYKALPEAASRGIELQYPGESSCSIPGNPGAWKQNEKL